MTSELALPTTLETIDVLLSAHNVYSMSPKAVEVLRVTEISKAAQRHYELQSDYQTYCDRSDFDPGSIKGIEDLDAVPLLPSSVFKRRDLTVLTCESDSDPDDVVLTTSSGTQGTLSVVPRDDLTLMRFFATVASGVREVLAIDDLSIEIHNLGPSPAEAAHLWIAYVLAGAAVMFDSRNYVANGVLVVGELIRELRAAERPVVIIGPPASLLEVADAADRVAVRLPNDSLVVSVGGWKKNSATSIDRPSYTQAVAKGFGLTADRVRDAFNMVELNTAIFECEHHAKHIPPWLLVTARRPDTLGLLSFGEIGILAYLDPTATSYPAFVLSDDFGSVLSSVNCPCGLQTDVLRIDRRINRLESRGCALKMNYDHDHAGEPDGAEGGAD